MEEVILVNEKDEQIGICEKLEAHQKGLLHRAFSILLFNSKGELLLQQRAFEKYHSAGLWTNTCCSHPRPNESIKDAAQRRLREELGIEALSEFAWSFIYKTTLENNLIEHELDHVLIGTFNGEPHPNPREIINWKFVDLKSIREDISQNPSAYTYWFKLIMKHPQLEPAAPIW